MLRATPGVINGSRSATMLVLAGLAAEVLELPFSHFVDDRPALAFATLLACTALAGALQLLLGLLRWGRALKYIPFPAFGEMAVLDAQPRSADAWVDGPVHYWALSRAGLEALGAAHPSIAFRLLANLGLELSGRLRATTRELRLAN